MAARLKNKTSVTKPEVETFTHNAQGQQIKTVTSYKLSNTLVEVK